MKPSIIAFLSLFTALSPLIWGGSLGQPGSRLIKIAPPAHAAETNMKESTLHIQNAWAKPNYGPNGAAYFTLHNMGPEPRYLISATSPLSERVELHEHLHQDGVMKMRKVNGDLEIPTGKTLTFKPGGLHVMLFQMTEKLKDGATLPLTLIFRNGERATIQVPVLKTPPMVKESGKDHQHHHGH